jgi:hypothetical protein
MKKIVPILCLIVLASGAAWAAAMGTSTHSVIPSEVQQIISVDYRALRNSEVAQSLKAQVLPDTLKEFEESLRTVGIDTEKDLEQLTFASYRTKTNGLRIVGVAQGQFTPKTVTRKLRLKKVKPTRYQDAFLYPMGSGMEMTFLDESTLLFGDIGAVKGAIDARNGAVPSLDSNSQINDMIDAVQSEPVWSVLDAQGTQNMMHSALGQAAQLSDYNVIKKRLLGSRYVMNFNNGVKFDLDVVTSDSMMAATLSSLVKAGMMYRKMAATPTEKMALEGVSVESDSSLLKLHFKTDNNRFESLLHSDLFAAVSR